MLFSIILKRLIYYNEYYLMELYMVLLTGLLPLFISCKFSSFIASYLSEDASYIKTKQTLKMFKSLTS